MIASNSDILRERGRLEQRVSHGRPVRRFDELCQQFAWELTNLQRAIPIALRLLSQERVDGVIHKRHELPCVLGEKHAPRGIRALSLQDKAALVKQLERAELAEEDVLFDVAGKQPEHAHRLPPFLRAHRLESTDQDVGT